MIYIEVPDYILLSLELPLGDISAPAITSIYNEACFFNCHIADSEQLPRYLYRIIHVGPKKNTRKKCAYISREIDYQYVSRTLVVSF